MTNEGIIFQLKERVRILTAAESRQTNYDAKELIRLERGYVEATIEFREKYGGIDHVMIESESEPA